MIERLILRIQSIILQYGAGGVFIATMIEEIVAPIPSSLVPMMAGFFLLPKDQPFLNTIWGAFSVIALPVACGITIGSLAVYIVGYLGGRVAIEKWGKWLGLSWQELEKIELRLTRGYGDEVILFGLRLMPIVPGVAISGFCGVVRYPLLKFLIISFLGATIRASALSIIGWKVGETYIEYADFISRIENYIFMSISVIAALAIGWYFFRRKKVNSYRP